MQDTTNPQPIDYSKASLNPQFQEKAPQIKSTILQLRTQGVTDDKIFSYLQQKGVMQLPKPPETPVPSSDTPGFDSKLNEITNNLSSNFQQGGKDVTSDITNVPKVAQEAGGSPLAYGAAGVAAAGHVAGDIAKTAGGILGSVITPFLPDSVKSDIQGVTKTITDKVNAIPGMTTEIAKGLGDVFNTISLKGGVEAEPIATNIAKEGTQIAGEVGEKVMSKTSESLPNISEMAGKVRGAIKPSLSPQEAVGQIVQGETGDISSASRALSGLDTSGVKTYKDLQAKINTEIKNLVPKVDAELSKSSIDNPTKGMSIKSLEQSVGEGKNAVKVNYVQQAISDLKDYYDKTNNASGLSKIKSIENNARIKGLTYKDVNDLARLHGQDISAFNANGEAASGLTKQAAENTRKGLKLIARQGLGGKEAKALDSRLSDLYDTKSMIDNMVEKVNKTSQKTPKIGVIPKAVEAGGKIVNTVTGGIPKAIGKAFGTTGSATTLSPLEIESNLSKNLKSIK